MNNDLMDECKLLISTLGSQINENEIRIFMLRLSELGAKYNLTFDEILQLYLNFPE
ncbi:hypothetical protein SAMN05518855_1007215 [Paenibacillus sp. CF384]|nr:hypothetical protein SAMN05518855_1007215 [Paenibacillus sp. CF384]